MKAADRLVVPEPAPASERMGPDGLLLILRRQIWVVLLVIVAVVGAAAAYLQTVDERYQTRATLVLTLSEIRIDRTAVQLESFELSRAIVETELDVLRSRAFAGEVADTLSLATHPAFARPPDAPPISEEERRAGIVDRLLSSYSVFRNGDSLAIEIVAESEDPELAAAIANTVARTYIDRAARHQRDEIEQSIYFLSSRVERLASDLTEMELELTDFIRQNGLDDSDLLQQMLAERDRLSAILPAFSSDGSRQGDADRVREDLVEIEERLREYTRAAMTLERMERTMELQQERYQSSIGRLNELETQLDFVPRTARHVTVARVPVQPSWPNRRVGLALSFVAAVVLAFIAALLAESFNRRIWSESDIHRVTGLVNFGAVPHIRRRGIFPRRHAPLKTLASRTRSVLGEGLRGILTLWMNMRPRGAATVLMISSSLPGEGKSTVAVSLAASAARDGLKVLLIDFDTDRQGASELSGAKRQKRTLEEILDGTTARERPTDEPPPDDPAPPVPLTTPSALVEGLDLLAIAARNRLNLHILRRVRDELMPGLRRDYDLIVLDTPPVLVVDDACRLAQLADGALLVVLWGRTVVDDLKEAHDRLVRSGAHVAGTVMNDVNPRKQRRYNTGGYIGSAAYGGYYRARG